MDIYRNRDHQSYDIHYLQSDSYKILFNVYSISLTVYIPCFHNDILGISFQRKNSFRNQKIQGPVGIPIPFLRSRYSSGLRELRVGPASSEAHTGSLSRVGYKELIFHTIQPVKMQHPSRSREQSNSPAGFYSH